MQPRLQTLKRLVSLYGVVEEMHSVELQRMRAAVREAQQAIEVQQQVASSARLDGRGALMASDRMGWEIAETHEENAGWKRRRGRVERQPDYDLGQQRRDQRRKWRQRLSQRRGHGGQRRRHGRRGCVERRDDHIPNPTGAR